MFKSCYNTARLLQLLIFETDQQIFLLQNQQKQRKTENQRHSVGVKMHDNNFAFFCMLVPSTFVVFPSSSMADGLNWKFASRCLRRLAAHCRNSSLNRPLT
jgi:hypothetical protein